MLCLVAAVTYAGGVVAQKPRCSAMPALQVTFLACVIGAVVCLPFAPGWWTRSVDAPGASTGWLVYLGMVPTALASRTWAYALGRTTRGQDRREDLRRAADRHRPGLAAPGRVPTALAFVGGALCLVGVVLSRRRGAQAPARTRASRRAPSARRSGGSAA